MCSSGGRDPPMPSGSASCPISPRLVGRFVWVPGCCSTHGDGCLRSIPGGVSLSGYSPIRPVDSTADPTDFGASRSDWTGPEPAGAGIACLPRSDLRREARIPGCVVANEGDPAQDGVERQDVVASTIRFGRRSGESNGPIRIGTFSCSSRKGRSSPARPIGASSALEVEAFRACFQRFEEWSHRRAFRRRRSPPSRPVQRPCIEHGSNPRHEQPGRERQVSASGRNHASSRGRRLGLTTGATARHDGA